MPKLVFIMLSALLVCSLSAKPKGKVWTTYESAKSEDPDFSIQGEYGSQADGMGVQVVALGDGQFDAYFLEGGLPGDGWDKSKKRVKVNGKTNGQSIDFEGSGIKASIKEGAISVSWDSKNTILKRIERESPTLGQKAPEGAVVLFDGLRNLCLEY